MHKKHRKSIFSPLKKHNFDGKSSKKISKEKSDETSENFSNGINLKLNFTPMEFVETP